MKRAWTTPADLKDRVQRRWSDGSLLTALAQGEPFPEQNLPVRGPSAGEIGEDLAAVQHWIADLVAGSSDGRRYELLYAPIGGRHFGRNLAPARARVTSYEQAWRLLGVAADVAAYQRVLELSDGEPALRVWATAHPLRALEIAPEWEQVLAAYIWLDRARGSGRYLREITAPGVDTKFVERQRSVLAQLLGVDRSAGGFVAALGLAAKPESMRLRFDAGFAGLPTSLSEATLRVDELAAVRVSVAQAVIVENEVTYLTLPVPREGVVLWGKGFEVGRLGRIPWLRGSELHYWGDLDTHGFAILNQLRTWLPQTQSFLMDRDTMIQHRDRWGREPAPTAAQLDRLTPSERALYSELVSDALGEALRLEQERIDWAWVEDRIPYE
jgi:hypothetical protein